MNIFGHFLTSLVTPYTSGWTGSFPPFGDGRDPDLSVLLFWHVHLRSLSRSKPSSQPKVHLQWPRVVTVTSLFRLPFFMELEREGNRDPGRESVSPFVSHARTTNSTPLPVVYILSLVPCLYVSSLVSTLPRYFLISPTILRYKTVKIN